MIPAAEAQQKYWIYLNDKNGPSGVILEKNNIPDILQFESVDVQPIVYSSWLNAISAELDYSEASQLRKFISIDSVVPLSNNYVYTPLREPAPKIQGFALEQIEANAFLERGYNGEGIKIGIIDAGFFKANKQKSLKLTCYDKT